MLWTALRSRYRIVENFRGRKLLRFLRFQNHTWKFSLRNLQSTMRTLRVCGCVAHARGPHLHKNWTGAIHERFLREILVLYRNTKVFSLESFLLYGITHSLNTQGTLQSKLVLNSCAGVTGECGHYISCMYIYEWDLLCWFSGICFSDVIGNYVIGNYVIGNYVMYYEVMFVWCRLSSHSTAFYCPVSNFVCRLL